MDEQKEETTYKLEAVLSRLYDSYNVVTREQFVQKLISGEFELHKVRGNCHALLRWIDNGDTLEVLTCEGSVAGSEEALEHIEYIARKTGAKRVIGLARYGWKELLTDLGFETGTKLVFFRKELS